MRGRAVLSHTAPTTPYRSAGRPEVIFAIERLIDLAARRHGFDRVAIRRRARAGGLGPVRGAPGGGQALWELCAYDRQTGQMQSATFMDDALPRADALPMFSTEISEVPSTSNPLGLRGGGEGGTTPALAAVVNAIVDALAELGVEHLEMPATPERVWRAISEAACARTR
jgi:CO/xanthine dehydrogenase Mo-binding subunit